MQLDSLIKYGKRSNIYKGKEYDFIQLPYWTVKVEVANALEEGNLLKAVEVVVGEKPKESKETMMFALWIVDSMKAVLEMESKALHSIPNKKLKEAGIEQLNIFGELNVIDSLAGGDILKYETIKNLPYEVVFNKMLMDHKTAEINKRFTELIG